MIASYAWNVFFFSHCLLWLCFAYFRAYVCYISLIKEHVFIFLMILIAVQCNWLLLVIEFVNRHNYGPVFIMFWKWTHASFYNKMSSTSFFDWLAIKYAFRSFFLCCFLSNFRFLFSSKSNRKLHVIQLRKLIPLIAKTWRLIIMNKISKF